MRATSRAGMRWGHYSPATGAPDGGLSDTLIGVKTF